MDGKRQDQNKSLTSVWSQNGSALRMSSCAQNAVDEHLSDQLGLMRK
jgi:hypothetical protein